MGSIDAARKMSKELTLDQLEDRIAQRDARYEKLKSLNAPAVILLNEKLLIAEAELAFENRRGDIRSAARKRATARQSSPPTPASDPGTRTPDTRPGAARQEREG